MYLTTVIVLIMLPILFITYRIRKSWLLWPLIVLPPLSIAPLALIPIRDPLILGMVWLPVLPFIPGSIIFIIIRIAAIIIKRPDKLIKIKLIRPTLTILMFISVFSYHHLSRNMANQYGIKMAKDIQAVCDSNGLCPAFIPNWKEEKGVLGEPNYYSSVIRELHIPYFLRYEPSLDNKSFTVIVVIGFNMGTYVEGGTGKKLKAVYSDEGGQYEIPIK